MSTKALKAHQAITDVIESINELKVANLTWKKPRELFNGLGLDVRVAPYHKGDTGVGVQVYTKEDPHHRTIWHFPMDTNEKTFWGQVLTMALKGLKNE